MLSHIVITVDDKFPISTLDNKIVCNRKLSVNLAAGVAVVAANTSQHETLEEGQV